MLVKKDQLEPMSSPFAYAFAFALLGWYSVGLREIKRKRKHSSLKEHTDCLKVLGVGILNGSKQEWKNYDHIFTNQQTKSSLRLKPQL